MGEKKSVAVFEDNLNISENTDIIKDFPLVSRDIRGVYLVNPK